MIQYMCIHFLARQQHFTFHWLICSCYSFKWLAFALLENLGHTQATIHVYDYCYCKQQANNFDRLLKLKCDTHMSINCIYVHIHVYIHVYILHALLLLTLRALHPKD